MDVIAMLLMLALVILLAVRQAGGFLAWAREEWRASRAQTFAQAHIVNPRLGSVATDDRVAHMVVRQRAYGKRLRREGRSLLAGKDYTPALTRAEAPPKPAKSGNVVRLRSRRVLP